eukprot:CAMPEP_0202978402 /NCGR_PEP_ID=MMETSP1396-20130829/84834_1 /ASSEMBLY_ACC=CAM_ASM_000872 /TAXON_ID= /ORGANISM="Pseudokeronopsis sp., Strain Brazil" /LENGTH=76 /DNA_ID=CAMNT_0049717357 /DNA_START=1110 /DNA_END=1340 /DNA_ORIENTATION=-
MEEQLSLISSLEKGHVDFNDLEQVEGILVRMAKVQKAYMETERGVQEQSILVEKLAVLKGVKGWKINVKLAFQEKT